MSNPVLDCIMSRNSVRSYTEDQIPEEDLKTIMKAGFKAATAMNSQSTCFSVVQNKEELKRYNDLAKDLFVRDCMMRGSDSPLLEKMQDPEFDIFYNAPTAIFVFEKEGCPFPGEDGSLAIGNMMIAAESLGYGSCWIGLAVGLGYYLGFKQSVNAPSGSTYVGCLILGKPAQTEEHPRGDIDVVYWSK